MFVGDVNEFVFPARTQANTVSMTAGVLVAPTLFLEGERRPRHLHRGEC